MEGRPAASDEDWTSGGDVVGSLDDEIGVEVAGPAEVGPDRGLNAFDHGGVGQASPQGHCGRAGCTPGGKQQHSRCGEAGELGPPGENGDNQASNRQRQQPAGVCRQIPANLHAPGIVVRAC